MTIYTPGPWRQERWDTIYASTTKIGQVTRPNCSNGAQIAQANARLIATAPELLKALQGFMFADGHDDFEPEVWDAARAAIAKATGEA